MAKRTTHETVEAANANHNPTASANVIGVHPFEVGLGAFLAGGSAGVAAGLLVGPIGVIAGTVIGALAGAYGGEAIAEMVLQFDGDSTPDTYTNRMHHNSHHPAHTPSTESMRVPEAEQAQRETWTHLDQLSKDYHADRLSDSDDS